MRSNKERLLDILEAIEKIEAQVNQNREAFDSDPTIQVWVVYHLQIIGEAASRLSSSFQDRHSEIPWDKIIGMRHVLVHGYFEIDLDIVWSAVINDLPDLKQRVVAMLKTITES